jgi:hypothetical protein
LNESGDLLIALKNLYVRPFGKPLSSNQLLMAAESDANGRPLSLAVE